MQLRITCTLKELNYPVFVPYICICALHLYLCPPSVMVHFYNLWGTQMKIGNDLSTFSEQKVHGSSFKTTYK